jgi:glutaredoxin
MKKIFLLTSPTCGPCHMIKSKIKTENLNVEIKDFSNVEDIEFFKKHNIKAVPRLVIEDGDSVEIIQGMDDIMKVIRENQ